MKIVNRRQPTPDFPWISRRPSGRWLVGAAVAVLAAAGCDSPTDLLPGVVAPETQPALALGVALPDPIAWATDASTQEPGAQPTPLATWTSSWDLPPAEGREVREATYAALVASLPPGRVAAVANEDLATLRQALHQARSLPPAALPRSVRTGLAQGELEADAASAVRDQGDLPAALVHVLRGSDALREIGPEAVARTLVDEVEGRLRRIQPSHAYSPEDAERLRRLAEGGRQALDEGNWVLAIRRAYYARALLTAH
ncbi:MAG: hypothetical protein LJF04_10415 [Gemmatimonadetes bacterium]|nr:hypothetical protein [Gemmatimonadota bacterium]